PKTPAPATHAPLVIQSDTAAVGKGLGMEPIHANELLAHAKDLRYAIRVGDENKGNRPAGDPFLKVVSGFLSRSMPYLDSSSARTTQKLRKPSPVGRNVLRREDRRWHEQAGTDQRLME